MQVGDTVNSNDVVATMLCEAPSVQSAAVSTAPEATADTSAHTDTTEVVDIVLPDLGGAQDVQVIEVLVQVGDDIAIDQALIVLEGDKATMEVPAAQAGTVVSIGVEVGKTVNAGDVIGQVEVVSARTTADTSAQRGSIAQPAAQVDKVDTGGVCPVTWLIWNMLRHNQHMAPWYTQGLLFGV